MCHFLFLCYGVLPDLHSFPTRRSSDLLERASRKFRPLRPLYCSIYEPEMWAHERFWKLAREPRMWAGTTFNGDRKSTRLNSSHLGISYAVFCLKKKKNEHPRRHKTDTR